MSTGKLRFLTLVKPVLCVLPEVAQPDRKIPFKVSTPPSLAASGLLRLRQCACAAASRPEAPCRYEGSSAAGGGRSALRNACCAVPSCAGSDASTRCLV